MKLTFTKSLRRYLHYKVVVLCVFLVVLIVLKVYAHFALPEGALSTCEHASFFCDLCFLVAKDS